MKKTIIAFSILAASLYAVFVYAADSYQVTTSTIQTINEHGTTKKVDATSCGANIFVPTKTSAEWNDFITNHQSCVTVSDATITCGDWSYNSCAGSILFDSFSISIADCKAFCESKETGSCCRYDSNSDSTCIVTDGVPTGTGSNAASPCT